jgi:hypothetical protein
MNEQTKQSLDGVKKLIDNYTKECTQLANKLFLSTILFFLFIALNIILWLTQGLSYPTLISSVMVVWMWFDGSLLETKIKNLIIWIAVLSDLHANLEQGSKIQELAP